MSDDIREGMKKALNALLTHAKGASYCMFVVRPGWANFRYRRSKDNLRVQVAGNMYIKPVKLNDSDVKLLEGMGIVPEEGSNDIFAKNFDEKPRDLDKIVDTVLKIFNEAYHKKDGQSAYIELDLGKGDNEEIREDIAQHFDKRDGKQFKFSWKRDA